MLNDKLFNKHEVVDKADKKRILVVEDDPILRSLMAEICGHTGHYVDEAADGVEGLAAYQTGKYGLILTDNNMPKMKGWDMMSEIKLNGNGVPVVLLTSDPALTVEKAKEHGFATYVPKPVRMSAVHDLIAEYIR